MQADDGHWPGDYGGPMFLMPGMVIALYTCGVLDSTLRCAVPAVVRCAHRGPGIRPLGVGTGLAACRQPSCRWLLGSAVPGIATRNWGCMHARYHVPPTMCLPACLPPKLPKHAARSTGLRWCATCTTTRTRMAGALGVAGGQGDAKSREWGARGMQNNNPCCRLCRGRCRITCYTAASLHARYTATGAVSLPPTARSLPPHCTAAHTVVPCPAPSDLPHPGTGCTLRAPAPCLVLR